MATVTVRGVWEYPFASAWVLRSGSATFTPTTGATLVGVLVDFDGTTTGATSLAPTDTNGTFTNITYSHAGNNPCVGVWYIANVAAGSHTITPPPAYASGDGEFVLYELNGLTQPVTITSNNSLATVSGTGLSQTWTIPSANGTPNAGDVAIGVGAEENSVSSTTTVNTITNSGWTVDFVENDGTNYQPACFGHAILSAGGAFNLSVNINDPNITNQMGALVTFAAPLPVVYPLMAQICI